MEFKINSFFLTKEGQEEGNEIGIRLQHDPTDYLIYSPYVHAVQTIALLATPKQFCMTLISNFRERAVSDTWIENFKVFKKQKEHNVPYKL